MTVNVPTDLRKSSVQLDEASEIARRRNPSFRLSHIAAHLPKAASARAAGTLEESWQTRFLAWARAVDSQSAAIRAAAVNWDDTDEQASIRARHTRRHLPLP